jgi:hypothetical protein
VALGHFLIASGDVLEMMRTRVRHVLHLLLVNVPGGRREGVQHRLPDADPTAVDQGKPGQTAAAQQTTRASGQDQVGDAAAGDDDA